MNRMTLLWVLVCAVFAAGCGAELSTEDDLQFVLPDPGADAADDDLATYGSRDKNQYWGYGGTRWGVLHNAATEVGHRYVYAWGKLAPPAVAWLVQGRDRNQYGADCSGFVAKVWELPTAMPYDVNKHPYSTRDFINSGAYWNRSDVTKPGAAMVRRSRSSGHIFMYEKVTGWGQVSAYEALNTRRGIIHGTRRVTSDYRLIRRHGL